ncbi:CocE/NonD family hydrolase [Pyruvatibacter sp. HU-CL02332]|uniref:CocE/NonD family hydrolase n=1 Tax=Pyruvatibacter sp. HU-CL02332 TaxID=3127650 RepID=UPI003106D04E
MRKLFIVTAGIVAILIAGIAVIFSSGPELHEPSDLSDFIGTPDSPIIIKDISGLEDQVIIDRNVGVETRDGVRLSANVYRPKPEGPFPVVMMLTAYHKDEGPNQYPDYIRRNATPEYNMGQIKVSPWTPWEGPDPAYWVQQGYAVVTLDSRGYGKSEGVASVLSMQDRHDFHDAITWAGTQDWSNGNVGLTGVSYLAIAQWVAASSAPEHLKAIMPWEGQSDNYREVLFHGGIPETAFTEFWLTRVRSKANDINLPPAAIVNFAGERPMLMKWLQENVMPPSGIALEEITVPALIAASWSDHGMHTRGSFEGFKRIGSQQKWLYTHGQPKWDVYYSPEALEMQTAFFDHFLKGADNGFDTRPRVRLEVRDTLDTYSVRSEDTWPLPATVLTPLYLDAATDALADSQPTDSAVKRYDAVEGGAVFRKTFSEETELTGNMKLKLWVEAEGADDMDLFVAIRKYDASGEEITFYAKASYTKGPVALGWLRVSQRELDPDRSTPAQPVLAHERSLPLSSGEIVPVEIEILPSGTRFMPGETLEVSVQGRDQMDHMALAHKTTVNAGQHVIHTGGDYDSHLLVPVIPK